MEKTDIPQTHVRSYCKHQAKDGRVCALYTNHHGDHKDNHLKSSWTDED